MTSPPPARSGHSRHSSTPNAQTPPSPTHRRSRWSRFRARPLFSVAVAAAIIVGLPTVAYTGVVATARIADAATGHHKVGTGTQPALGSHRGATPGGKPGGSNPGGTAPGGGTVVIPSGGGAPNGGTPGQPGVPGKPGSPVTPIPPVVPNPPGPGGCQVNALLIPTCGLLWGVAPGEFTSTAQPTALHDWESDSGQTASIYHVYERGDDKFPTAQQISLADEPGHHRLLLINWKVAWGTTWAAVSAGKEDGRIDAEAAYLKSHFSEKFFLAPHHEPENDVNENAGSGMTAKDYAAMFRHTVLRLRADGVTNAVFVLAYMGYEVWCEAPWFNDLWPGADVVDWIGYDPYTTAKTGAYAYGDFAKLVNGTHKPAIWPGFYNWATTVHAGKPLMLAEWGVFEYPTDLSQKAWIDSTVAAEVGEFPALKGLVYFDSPDAPKGDTRIISSSSARSAFHALATSSLFDVNVDTANLS